MNDHNYWICFIFLYKNFTRLASKQYYSFGFFDSDIFMKSLNLMFSLCWRTTSGGECSHYFLFGGILVLPDQDLCSEIFTAGSPILPGLDVWVSGNWYLCSPSLLHRSWKKILNKWLQWRFSKQAKNMFKKRIKMNLLIHCMIHCFLSCLAEIKLFLSLVKGCNSPCDFWSGKQLLLWNDLWFWQSVR